MTRRQLIFIIFVLNIFLSILLTEVNHFLTPYVLFIHFESLLILFPAFYFQSVPGLVLASGFAFFIGADRPVSLGLTLLTFILLWLIGNIMRMRIRRENHGHIATFAAITQAITILLYGLTFTPPENAVAEFWQHIVFEAIFSACVVAMLSGMWCAFQRDLLLSFGWNLQTESQNK